MTLQDKKRLLRFGKKNIEQICSVNNCDTSARMATNNDCFDLMKLIKENTKHYENSQNIEITVKGLSDVYKS